MSQVAIVGLNPTGRSRAFLSDTIQKFSSEAKAWALDVGGTTVTCTTPTAHYADGCELLNHYDADNDGNISTTEMQAAVNDYLAGIITVEEANFVRKCWELDEINAMCPGCYTLPPPPCTCTAWVNAECTEPGKRRQTRACTPAGCDIEERIIDDPSCMVTSAFFVFTAYPGPFIPNVDAIICRNDVQNTGAIGGIVNTTIAELNAAGTPIDVFCQQSVSLTDGFTYRVKANQDTRECILADIGEITINKPAGTYYYGIKTWGESEAEPSYPAPTALMAAIGEEEGRGIVNLIKCMFPRLMTKTPTPRITNKERTPRIRCIKESEITSLRSKTGALSATRGRKLGGRLLAKVITVNGVKYKEI